MDPWPHYSRAPLVSAGFELRLTKSLSEQEIEKLGARFSKLRWNEERLTEFQFKVEGGKASVAGQKFTGFRYTSPDADRVLMLDPLNLSLSVLPPYPGWEPIIEELFEYAARWRKVIGERPLGRIGVRYINRFDIPCAPGQAVRIQDYLVFGFNEPALLDMPLRALTTQFNGGIIADNLFVNLASGTVEAPVLEHVSLSLDVDIFREAVDVPQEDADIRSLLELVRTRRTQIFEACITDATRKLIS